MSSSWFLFPWFPEHGDHHIHPDDLATARTSSPYGHVFEHLDTSDGWFRLRYSAGIIRIRPELLRPILAPAFSYCAPVTTVAPRSPASGTVHAIHWHHQDSAHLFFLKVEGKVSASRYRAGELRPKA